MAYNRSRKRQTNLYLGKQTDLNTAATSFAHSMTGATLDYVPGEERDEYEDYVGRPTMSGRSFTPEPVRNLTAVTQGGRFDFNQILSPLVCGIGASGGGDDPDDNDCLLYTSDAADE